MRFPLRFVVCAGFAVTLSTAAFADDVYNACVNTPAPSLPGPQHAAGCKCLSQKVSGKRALQEEAISLSSMSSSDWSRKASPSLSPVISQCFGG